METTAGNCLPQSEFMWRQISGVVVVELVFLISILFINILGLLWCCQDCVRASTLQPRVSQLFEPLSLSLL